MTRCVVNQMPWKMMPIARTVRIGPAAVASARDNEGTKSWSEGVARVPMPAANRMVNTATLRRPNDRSSRTPRRSPAAAFSLMRVNRAVMMEVVTRDCGSM